jgi:hypothetical protein
VSVGQTQQNAIASTSASRFYLSKNRKLVAFLPATGGGHEAAHFDGHTILIQRP